MKGGYEREQKNLKKNCNSFFQYRRIMTSVRGEEA